MSSIKAKTNVEVGNQPGGSSRLAESVINTLLASALTVPVGDSTTDRQPLSLQVSSANFKRFISKAGPIFWFNDQVEAIFRWQDRLFPITHDILSQVFAAIKTLFWAACYAVLCYKPSLVIVLPQITLASILLTVYSMAHPNDRSGSLHDPLKLRSRLDTDQLERAPEVGTVDYLDNLRNIQTLMGRMSAWTDIGRSCVPYLDWTTHPRVSLVLLQVSILSGIACVLLMPYIPWRLVFLVLGESVLVASHPACADRLLDVAASFNKNASARTLALERALQDDSLSETALSSLASAVHVHVIEEQRQAADGNWTAEHRFWPAHPQVEANGPSIERTSPDGYAWLDATWQIDPLQGCDASKFSPVSLPGSDKTTEGWYRAGAASVRSRRWSRRAI